MTINAYAVADPIATHALENGWCRTCGKSEALLTLSRKPCQDHCLRCNHKGDEVAMFGTVCDNCGMSDIGMLS